MPGLERRIRELDRDRDIERLLEANASTILLISLTLGAFHHPGWRLLPVFVASMLRLYALQGWCPPVPLFLRLRRARSRPNARRRRRCAATSCASRASAANALQAAE